MEKNDIKNDNRIERIKTICIIVLSMILVVNLIIGIISITNGGKFGFYSLRFFIMSSDSDDINAGDLVVANRVKASNLKENDTVIYKRNNSTIIKNIEKVNNTNNEINIYVMKTKNNSGISNEESYERIENNDIMGKVLFKVRGVGNMAVFIKSPLGTLNFLLILLCIFIVVRKIIDSKEKVLIKEIENGKEKE